MAEMFGGKRVKPDPALVTAQKRSLQQSEIERAKVENERAAVMRRAAAGRRGLGGLGYAGTDQTNGPVNLGGAA
jgi:hypothetical protein